MMDQRTLTALKASIRHWEENVAAEKPDDASARGDDCALCGLFANAASLGGNRMCDGCPVAAKAHDTDCFGTPYYEARGRLDIWRRVPKADDYRDAWRAAAQAELDFLKSLLPETARAAVPTDASRTDAGVE